MTDLQAVTAALRQQTIETPSWGYGDSGTRFGTFPQPGRPRDAFERIDDAASEALLASVSIRLSA